MDTKNFKDRSALRGYFLKNKIPTEANFAELINSSLNQLEDGIFKPTGDPLSLVTAGDAAGPQKLVNFYGNVGDAKPAWTFQMRPRTDPDLPATAKAGFSVSDGDGNSRLFVDAAGGNVGIGTLAPGGKLTVAGDVILENEMHQMRLRVNDQAGFLTMSNDNDMVFDVEHGPEVLRLTSTGLVGVGTDEPAGIVDVANLIRIGLDEGGSGLRCISFGRDAGDEGNAGKISYKGSFGNALNIVGAGTFPRKIRMLDDVEVVGVLTPSAGASSTDGIRFLQPSPTAQDQSASILYFSYNSNGYRLVLKTRNGANNHIALMPSGNVGIGTYDPTSKLSVAGSIAGGETNTGWVLGRGAWGPDNWLRLTTTQNGSTYHDFAINSLWTGVGHDLAEITPVDEDARLEHGDVVVIDPAFGLRVTRCAKAGDTAVYGVVSSFEQAAMVIGGIGGPEAARDNLGNLPIALIGRVAVKASAENGPIAPGDMLTTAATPGHAMRCDDRIRYAGAIVGKALEPLQDGVGVIKMLVAMQ